MLTLRLPLTVVLLCLGVPWSAAATDTYEPNNTLGTATPIASGTPLVSYIETGTDVDYYEFTLFGTQHVRIDLDMPATVNYSLSLYNENGGTATSGYFGNHGDGLDERL